MQLNRGRHLAQLGHPHFLLGCSQQHWVPTPLPSAAPCRVHPGGSRRWYPAAQKGSPDGVLVSSDLTHTCWGYLRITWVDGVNRVVLKITRLLEDQIKWQILKIITEAKVMAQESFEAKVCAWLQTLSSEVTSSLEKCTGIITQWRKRTVLWGIKMKIPSLKSMHPFYSILARDSDPATSSE